MIVGRYIIKEIIATLLMIVMILLFIQMSNQFILYLNSAAAGGITLIAIFKLMMIQIPLYMSYLLPLGLFLSVLIVFGQLYTNHEMSVLFACGYSEVQLTKLVMMVAAPIALATALVIFELQPLIQKYQSEMKRDATNVFSVDKLFPKRFQDIMQLGWVLYADKELENGMGDVFLVRHYPSDKDYPHGFWEVIRAKQLYQHPEEERGSDFAYLQDGVSYKGQPGQKNYRMLQFQQGALELNSSSSSSLNDRKKSEFLSLQALWRAYGQNKANQVEFNWRLSIPFCALILALWVVPLSHLNPRQGRYAKVFYASLVCLFYLNMMFASRGLAFAKDWSPILTIWWIHVVMLLALLVFLSYRRGKLPSIINFLHSKKSTC